MPRYAIFDTEHVLLRHVCEADTPRIAAEAFKIQFSFWGEAVELVCISEDLALFKAPHEPGIILREFPADFDGMPSCDDAWEFKFAAAFIEDKLNISE